MNWSLGYKKDLILIRLSFSNYYKYYKRYLDNDDIIELDDEEDYAMLKKNPNDRIQIKVTTKNID